jgi:hypothetical protein
MNLSTTDEHRELRSDERVVWDTPIGAYPGVSHARAKARSRSRRRRS